MNWLTFFVPLCFEVSYNSHSKQNNTGHHDGNGYSKNHHRTYRTKQAYDGNRYSTCKNHHRTTCRTKPVQVSWDATSLNTFTFKHAQIKNILRGGGETGEGFFDNFFEYFKELLLYLRMYMIIKIKMNIITCRYALN